MKKNILVISVTLLSGLLLGACSTLLGGGDDLESTQVALYVQQTQFALEQGQAAQPQQPEEPLPEVPQPEQPQPAEPQPEEPMPEAPIPEEPQPEEPRPEEPMPEELFLEVTAEPKESHCNPFADSIVLTVTVTMSDIDRGANLFWRLHEKATDVKLDWEVVDMLRVDDHTRSFSFTAGMMPVELGESWFEFQIVSNDGADRTEVFADVTFFPCV